MSTLKSFVKETVARLTGDSTEVIAQQNYRKATSALTSQIAQLNYKKVDAEQKVENAKEALKEAKYPTSLIQDGSSYLDNINNAYFALETAKEELEQIEESIDYYETLQEEFEAEA